MQVLLDSNIVIYSLQAHHKSLRKWLRNHSPVVSAITQLEVLGFPDISSREMDFSNRYLSLCQIIPIDQSVILQAIELRQIRKMSIGDAIIAATAIVNNLPLATANIKDFEHLEILDLIHPL